MSLIKKYLDVYSNWDLETFRNIHHEDYMFIRETDLLTRDEHVDNFVKLTTDPNWNWDWFKSVRCCLFWIICIGTISNHKKLPFVTGSVY